MQPPTPLLSIITVCYNAADLLERTLQSVASQSFDNYEYIVIDGASKDDTPALLQRYAGLISRSISEPDHGIYDAMNKGIKLASGEYLLFLNAGDTLPGDTTLADLFAPLISQGHYPDVLYGDTMLVDQHGKILRRRRLSPPERLTRDSFRAGMLVCHQSFYPRRAIAPLYDLRYRFSADVDWCIRILEQAQETYNSHLVLTHYLHEGATTRHHRASLRERFHIMGRHYGWASTICRHIGFALRALYKR